MLLGLIGPGEHDRKKTSGVRQAPVDKFKFKLNKWETIAMI